MFKNSIGSIGRGVSRVRAGVVMGFVALCLILSVLGQGASAQTITVSGTSYDITVYTAGTPFATNQAAIEASPWWGSQPVAEQFAVAYGSQVGPAPLAPGLMVGQIFFIFNTAGSIVFGSSLDHTGAVIGSNADIDPSAVAAYASAVASTPVPEINGAALIQVLFVLFAFGLWLRVRRAHAV